MEKIIDIQVRSRSEAKEFKEDLPWAAISISTMPDEFPELHTENCLGVLQLSFFDSEFKTNGPQFFNKDHADKIVNFLKEMLPQIECLLIHCEMGVSRSPAIAAAICHVLYGQHTETIYFKNYNPNILVYRKLVDALKQVF